MGSDGVKTDRRKRSLRNKIVTGLGSLTTVTAAVEATAPGTLPPSVLAVAALLTTLTNIYFPK